MNILFFDDHEVWVSGLPEALRRLGHTVQVPQLTGGLPHLQRVLQTLRPDVVLTVGWTPRHTPDNLRAIRGHCAASRSLHVYWSVEDPVHTNVWTRQFLDEAGPDAVVTVSPSTVEWLREMGYPAEELPFACDPALQRPVAADPRYRVDVALVATLYATMAPFRRTSLDLLLRPLVAADLRVGVWGLNWDQAPRVLGYEIPRPWLRGPLRYGELAGVYSSARLVLGLQNHPQQLTSRTFEVLGCGGLLLTVRTPGVERSFRAGEHLLCSGSAEETLALVRRYLNDGQGGTIARQGRAAVLAAHTYDHRAGQLMGWVDQWLAAKRSRGHIDPRSHRRRQILPATLRPVAAGTNRQGVTPSADGTVMRLHFRVPAAASGERLRCAVLECCAERVETAGEALCRLAGLPGVVSRCALGARGRTAYPHDDSWCRFDLTSSVEELGRRTVAGWPHAALDIDLDVAASGGLRAVWAWPGAASSAPFGYGYATAYLPRLDLLWRHAP